MLSHFNDSLIFLAISINNLDTSCSGLECVKGSPKSAEFLKS